MTPNLMPASEGPLDILVVALHYPPVGGPATQRAYHFARELGARGHRLTVITGPGRSHDPWAPHDTTQLADVLGVTISRFSTPEPAPTKGLDRAAERLALSETPFSRWFSAELADLVVGLTPRPDVILGELVPYQVARPIAVAARTLGVPWVADLHDPWALDEMWLYPTVVQRTADRRRMHRILSSASVVVMNTPEAALRVRAAFPTLRGRISAISSGFDPADFSGPPPDRHDGAFRIVHTGSMHTAQGERHGRTRVLRRMLGGMPNRDLEILPRSHVYLLAALDQVQQARPNCSLELHLAGPTTEEDRRVAAGRPFVRFHGFLTHDRNVELMRSADLLFLPMHDLRGRAGLVPTKLYEYLGSGRPILAAVPEGDARDILVEAGNAAICGPSDVDGMAQAVITDIDRHCGSRGSKPAPRSEIVSRYTWGSLTDRLEHVLRAVATMKPIDELASEEGPL